MTDSVQSLDSVIGRSHGKLWNVHTCNIRFKASKSSFGSYAVCILVDGKLSLPIPVKKSPMLKAWAWNDMVHTRSIISYMGIIAPANEIKRLEFLLHIMPWYHKYMYSVDCGLMIWRKGRGYWSLHFFSGKHDKVTKWVKVARQCVSWAYYSQFDWHQDVRGFRKQ